MAVCATLRPGMLNMIEYDIGLGMQGLKTE